MQAKSFLLPLVLFLGAPAAVSAQDQPAEEVAPSPEETASSCAWDPGWSRFSVAESIATGTMATGILVAQLALPKPTVAHWSGAILLDDATRDGMRGSTLDAREDMAGVSDALLTALLVMPFADAALAWLVHGEPEVAAEMTAMNVQSFALTMLVTELTKRLVGRERPYGQECAEEDTSAACNANGRYESFLSGHTSMAFTAAGLVCAHHENLPLLGGAADPAACMVSIAAATTVGAMRIGADRHYLSDVIVGAGLGLLSGYALPNWLHYDIGDTDPDTGMPEGGRITPMATPGGAGFGYEHVWY